MNTELKLPKLGAGDTVTVKYHIGLEPFSFTGTVKELARNQFGRPVLVALDETETKAFDLELSGVDCVILERKAGEENFVPSPIDDSVVEALKREVHTPSFYSVSFRICLGENRIATVSGRKPGKLSPTELIQLAILANYRQLSYFTGSWHSVTPFIKLIRHYVKDDIPMLDSSFGVDGVSISCYDAEKGKFYDIPIPNPRHLLVENLDAAYNYYICKWEPPHEKD